MASTSPSHQPLPLPTPVPPSSTDKDWPAQAADIVVDKVELVRSKTAGPTVKAARYLVFAAFAVVVGTMILLLFVLGVIRLVDVYLPDALFGEEHMWATYLVVGLPLVLVGLLVTGRKMSAAKG